MTEQSSTPKGLQNLQWYHVAAPATVFLGAGAVVGYRRTLNQEVAHTKAPPRASRQVIDAAFSPTRHAVRALGYGAVLACTGCGVGLLAVKWATGARSMQEFSAVMQQAGPQVLKSFGWQPSEGYEAEKQRAARMTIEEELQSWADAARREEAHLQESTEPTKSERAAPT